MVKNTDEQKEYMAQRLNAWRGDKFSGYSKKDLDFKYKSREQELHVTKIPTGDRHIFHGVTSYGVDDLIKEILSGNNSFFPMKKDRANEAINWNKPFNTWVGAQEFIMGISSKHKGASSSEKEKLKKIAYDMIDKEKKRRPSGWSPWS